jgi:hypothetical protein
MVGNENNIDKMRRTAIDHSERAPRSFHKGLFVETMGTGPECSWFEADSLAARAAL